MENNKNSERWFDDIESLDAYKARIKYMEGMVKMLKWESSVKAHLYLGIKGRMKAKVLSELLELRGEKSIFRTLKPLLSMGMIEKIPDEYNLRDPYYQITGKSVNDPKLSKKFLEYLYKNNNISLLSEYLAVANSGSITLIKVMTEVMEDKLSNGNIDTSLELLNKTMFFEGLFSSDDTKVLIRKIEDFLKNEIAPLIKEIPKAGGLKHPMGFYFTLMPLG